MCGIAGLWRLSGDAEADLARDLRGMTDVLAHRGPDGDGAWIDPDVGIALGHRRLAIIDLSPAGAQPMASANGQVVISYNGELYNRDELAAELAMPFRGTSDTEVLVEAIARFGIDGALARANGMFAFAAYDRVARALHLVRDRLGIKPLYWIKQGGLIAFASQLKALRVLGGLAFEIDPSAVASFLRLAAVPAPRTIYRNVEKLEPGWRIEITPAGIRRHCYWDLADIAVRAQALPDLRPENEIDEEIHALLSDAVARQMVSDVPLGAFLSGGIDSSTVVALMQRHATQPVKTFSIGFREAAFNEADAAAAVASHLGTDHTEVILTSQDALALVPKLPEVYDEPFADSSQLPTMLVSAVARCDVTVALSGDGGDEVFGGYVRYQAVARLDRWNRRIPRFARGLAAALIESVPAGLWDTLAGTLPQHLRPSHPAQKFAKGAALLKFNDALDMYRQLVSHGTQHRWLSRDVHEPPDAIELLRDRLAGLDVQAQLRLLDQLSYLSDDILTKVDRASMAVGLEVRVPLLDHRVVEAMWRWPSGRLIANGEGKRPLRRVLDAYVPRALVERPKTGFGIPVTDWLRGPLRDWAEDLLSPAALAGSPFDPVTLRAGFAEFLAGRRELAYGLWAALQYQAWRRSNS